MDVTVDTELLEGLTLRTHFAISKKVIYLSINFTIRLSHFFSGLVHLSSSFFSRIIFLEISLPCHAHWRNFPSSASQSKLHNASYKLVNQTKIPQSAVEFLASSHFGQVSNVIAPSVCLSACLSIRVKQFENLWIFIHSFISLSYDRFKASSKAALHTGRSRAFSFKWEYPLLSLRSSSSFLRLLPRLPVTSIHPFIFPSITRCRRQFLRKMWPIQLAFHFLISCRIFLCSLTLSNTYSFLTKSVQLIFSIFLQHHISELSRCFWSTARSVQFSAPYKAML